MEVTRVKELEDNVYLRNSLVTKFDATVFKIEAQIKSLDIFKDSYESLCVRADESMQ